MLSLITDFSTYLVEYSKLYTFTYNIIEKAKNNFKIVDIVATKFIYKDK